MRFSTSVIKDFRFIIFLRFIVPNPITLVNYVIPLAFQLIKGILYVSFYRECLIGRGPSTKAIPISIRDDGWNAFLDGFLYGTELALGFYKIQLRN